jgi:cellobiose phosphorylase
MRPHPDAIVLTNGRFASLISDAGGGGTVLEALALTRWVPDATVDAHGQWLYVRDLHTGRYWSATAQPVITSDACYDVKFRPGVAELSAVANDIEVKTSVCVAPDDDVELRLIKVTNRGRTERRLELTSYAELVLNTAVADVGHPAFSKLFVQTRFDATLGTLVAWRRLRSPDDVPLVVAQALFTQGTREAPSYESDRMRFVGRGRTLAAPAALDHAGELSGTVGNVLDPIFALRRTVSVAPGNSQRLVLVLAAARDEHAIDVVGRYSAMERVEGAFDAAAARAAKGSLVSRWSRVPSATGALAYGVARSGTTDAIGLSSLVDESALHKDIESLLDTADSDLSRERQRRVVATHNKPAERPSGPARPLLGAQRTGEHFAPVPQPDANGPTSAVEELIAFNGHGGFNAQGDEYVIRIACDGAGDSLRLPPLPWSNVVANENAGFIVSEIGAGYTWAVNSRENRLTPWYNDPVSDPHGEALWLRDEDTDEFWSPLPGPTPAQAAYEARHGFGYSRWTHHSHELLVETCLFVPRHDPVKIVHLRVTNRGTTRRQLALFSYAQWVLGRAPHETTPAIESVIDHESGALFARNARRGEFSNRTAFASIKVSGSAEISCTSDRAAFLGPRGSMRAPLAVSSGEALDSRSGGELDPCAAFRAAFVIEPGASVDCVVLIGEADGDAGARALVQKHTPATATHALDEVRAFWRTLISAVRIETPSPALDLMANGWLTYQNLSCRMWGRSAFYQSGGAYGFRDQLQDSAALVYLDPSITRRQIVLHAAHQFVEGDVLHWWHPPTSKGIRTRFSDDLLWLPFVATFYARTTGDDAVFDEKVPFVQARSLAPDEDEVFLVPEVARDVDTVYEHCCRAIDRSLTRGAHGLPLMGVGDWNDGMNRVGRGGHGESVWLGFFLHDVLRSFIPLCERRGDRDRAQRYGTYQRDLRQALNAESGGWDGEWYRRAYYDDGAPLGSRLSDECKIDAIAQAWSVLSGAAPAERAGRALDALEEHLVSETEGIVRLLTPAFDKTPHDPGYIKGYLPGVRENGGQYTHGALWAVRALAEVGREERAARLLEMLSPVTHGSEAAVADTYKGEPYVIAADVYGVAPHVGRVGWTWYTGSAGWMYRVTLESVLGFSLEGGRVARLRPCIPKSWPGFSVRYRLPNGSTTYELRVRRATAGEGTSIVVGQERARVENGSVVVDLVDDGGTNVIDISLGSDVGRSYRGSDDV